MGPEQNGREVFLAAFSRNLGLLEAAGHFAWYQGGEGKAFLERLTSIEMAPLQTDKAEYFSRAMMNAPLPEYDGHRDVFLSLLERLSRPALLVFGAIVKCAASKLSAGTPQVLFLELRPTLRTLGYSAQSANACIQELVDVDLISCQVEQQDDRGSVQSGEKGVYGVTDLSYEFYRFIRR